ncbi:cell wall metabolism sensor histidine kinase WalK [Fictibacillus phosphorivorans]|uniref:cell wall metabolism sensor histidine kinase WalK n=1 Tax=Fictibacillus phosphorivorans TaxID=1221500 RepID=UPI002040C967|nr:cell wall metabolism sensor histidine kinase WalK [Fictibacillus phosphorivorans]MCM3719528.1 cell wall metabolism sensor histidine kinase WalK [Fictibacillus phosphorivorans]MCM3777219.1 cell wall metabolism sensor histidine kinase WalK [Fictibacillus phosphorivorans]
MDKVNFFKSIHVKFVLIYVLLILIAMQVISVYFINNLENDLRQNFTKSLYDRVNLLEFNIEQKMKDEKSYEDLKEENEGNEEDIKTLEQDIQALIDEEFEEKQVQVLNKDGVILASSNQRLVGQISFNPKIKLALEGTQADEIMLSGGERVMVLAKPIINDDTGATIGAIYLEASIESIFKQIQRINNILVTGTVIALIITGLLGVFLARTITRPMADMRKQALVMARGDFSRKVQLYGDDEIGQLAMTFNNLTKKLQEATAITESERRKLRSVLTYMTDGVIATDRDGAIILMNDRAEEMLNISRQNALGTSLMELLRLNTNYTWEELYNEYESMLLDFSTDDLHYVVRANFSTIQKDDGPINGLICVLHDVTEQEQIDNERREFVFNVSHELRTPLTTMRSYLEALADGAWQDENIAPRFLEVTQNETERMIRLVTDLLQLSKMDSKDYRFNFREIDLVEFLDGIVERFEMLEKENIVLSRSFPDQVIPVQLDTDKMTQVVDNIISNAMKYSPEGGTITIAVTITGRKVRVSISDQGVGIPKNNVSKIFDRFFRVDRARSRDLGGTGLGLAIAKEIVLAHGGDIWAESEWGQGTTIHFTLPLRKIKEGQQR